MSNIIYLSRYITKPTTRQTDLALARQIAIDHHLANEELANDHDRFLESMETVSPEFMFPTILAKYRKGINPVKSIYYSMQEAVLKYDPTDPTYVWVLGLFEDHDWYEKLMIAIRADLHSCEMVLRKHIHNDSSMAMNYKRNLANILEDYQVYIDIFSMLADWKNDNAI